MPGESKPPQRKFRIAWISPLTEQLLLRSDLFTRRVLPEAEATWDIELFTDDQGLAQCTSGQESRFHKEKSTKPVGRNGGAYYCSDFSAPIYHYQLLPHRNGIRKFDATIIQLEDHPALSFAARLLPLWPGICIFHDLNLNQMYFDRFKESTGGTDLNAEMSDLFGPHSIPLGDYSVRKWSIEVYDRVYRRGQFELLSATVPLLSSTALHEQSLFAGAPWNRCFGVVSFPRVGARGTQFHSIKKSSNNSSKLRIVILGSHAFRDRLDVAIDASNRLKERLEREKMPVPEIVLPIFREAEEVATGQQEALTQIQSTNCESVVSLQLHTNRKAYLAQFANAQIVLALAHLELRGPSLEVMTAAEAGAVILASGYSALDKEPFGKYIPLTPGQPEAAELDEALIILLREWYASDKPESSQKIPNLAVRSEAGDLQSQAKDSLSTLESVMNERLAAISVEQDKLQNSFDTARERIFEMLKRTVSAGESVELFKSLGWSEHSAEVNT